MNKRFIDPIPEEFVPGEDENVFSQPVFRAVHTKEMTVGNFLPSYIEKPRNQNSFIPVNKSYFSLSIFRSVEECKSKINRYPSFAKTFVGFAIGKTNIERGVALTPNNEGHIDYFLYDHLNNNPCVDFLYFEDK